VRWALTATIFGALGAASTLSGSAAPAWAETLGEAVEAAIAYHPRIIRDQARSMAADHAVEAEFSAFYPSLDVEGSSGSEITNSPTTRGAGTDTTHLWRTEGSATVTQMVFDFFETTNRVESAQNLLRARHADIQATSEIVARDTILRYLQIMQARRLLDLAQRSVADHVAILDLIRGRADAGQASQADLDQAVSRVALVRSNLVDIQGLERQAVSQYIETVGMEPGELSLPEEPDYPEATDLDAALATAMDRNPVAHSTSAVWDARRSDIEVARAAYFPRFDVEATGAAGENFDGVEGSRTDLRVFLRMRWELFSGFGDVAAVRRATFEANAASRSDAEARRVIRESVRIAFHQLQTTKDRIPILREDVESSQLVFGAYREQYDLGQRTLLDLLDARDEQFNAEADLLNGEFDVLQAHYDLLFGMGTILDEFGIVIYEPELRFEERAETPNETAEAKLETEVAGEGDSTLPPALTFNEVKWDGEVGLPGAGEFGSWLAEDGQTSLVTTAALTEDEGAWAEALVPAAGDETPRTEFAGIEVEAVPAMAALPEHSVAELPAVAFGELDKLDASGFRNADFEEFSLLPAVDTAAALPAALPAALEEPARADDTAATAAPQEASGGLLGWVLGDDAPPFAEVQAGDPSLQ